MGGARRATLETEIEIEIEIEPPVVSSPSVPPDLPASRHVVVDVDYLAQLVDPERPPPDDGLDAAAWGDALQYAGVRPLLGEVGDQPGLEGGLHGLSVALGRLQAVEARGQRLRGWVPRPGRVPEWLVLVVAALGLALLLAGHALAGGLGLVLVAAFVLLGRSGGRAAPAPTGPEVVARRSVTLAVRSLLAHSRVEAVGAARTVVEVAPHAALLRHRVHQLDAVLDQARARKAELVALAARIRAANRALGRAADDAETARLDAQAARVAEEMERVRGLRARFGRTLSQVEDHLEHLRLLAVRRALSQRVDQVAADAEGLGRDAAAAEVDALELERTAEALAREVGDATQALAATLEVAALAAPR